MSKLVVAEFMSLDGIVEDPAASGSASSTKAPKPVRSS
jgi:uncharacterized membrane protein